LEGLVPILLENGCSEEGCTIDSDDVFLTNRIRKHYLEHFGRRDLDGMVSDYAPNAFLIQVVNGKRTKYHGQNEIRKAFEEVFALHPVTTSTFHLRNIEVDHKHGMVFWSAATQTHTFPMSTDTFVFNSDGKIIKHFFTCQMNELDHPWYVED
jgi:ketosteroid isomerase-like protein